jgi:glucose-1-phosphate adenylyltransferase
MKDPLKKLTTIIMAGGKGERLFPLTRDKAKPSITFGGIYRIIDFTLSNCINSGVRRIYVLSQYGSFSLDQHLRQAWDIMHPDLGEYIYNLPPQQIMVNRWYRNTADSIYQNLTLLEQERPEQVLILSGDHVYKMDYLEMLDFHLSRGADLTVATAMVPRVEASSFGILKINAAAEVEGFLEKPKDPPGMPDNPDYSLSSMGVYIFKARSLVEEVIKDAKKKTSKHDFGGDVIPQMVGRKQVFAFNFQDPVTGKPRYWRDIGLLDAYFKAHQDLLGTQPTFDLFDPEWPLRCRPQLLPPSRYSSAGQPVCVEDSLIASGCIIEGQVLSSVLSPGVIVGRDAQVESAVLWDGVVIGPGARIKNVVIEEGVKVPPGFAIGYDRQRDAKRFPVTDHGVAVVPNNVVLGD